MKVPRKVPGEIQSQVRSQVHAGAEIISASKPNRKKRKASLGRYLGRSGNSYVFQMRLPKKVLGDRPNMLRLTLGPMPYLEARRLADELAGVALKLLRMIGAAMDEQNDKSGVGALLGGASDDDDLLTVKFITMLMKSTLYDLQQPDAPPTAEETRGHEMIRNLVTITQERTAKQEGRSYNPIVADNAEMLASTYAQSWVRELKSELPPAPVIEVRPVAEEPDMSAPAAEVLSALIQRPADPPKMAKPQSEVVKRGSGKASISRGLETLEEKGEGQLPDRRDVDRPLSDLPLFSDVASEYLGKRAKSKSADDKDIRTAEMRLNLFIELVGDHPIDTCSPADMQAFIDLARYWPAKVRERMENATAREIIEDNCPPKYQPIAMKTLREGFVAVIRAALLFGAKKHSLTSSVAGARYEYSKTNRRSIATEPLSASKITTMLAAGLEGGLLDEAMLPLLALLTGRRIGLLVHLKGRDFRRKFDGVWVAQTEEIVYVDGFWKRVPIKGDASMTYFVIHEFLVEIGFVDWAVSRGDDFIFSELMRLKDPAKSASSYMGRLMRRAGVKESKGEVFHSFRAGYISHTRKEKISERDSKLQVGHALGEDEHELYGFRNLTEDMAIEFAALPLNPKIDLSGYRGLDFDKLAAAKRGAGRRIAKGK
jgi:integrase